MEVIQGLEKDKEVVKRDMDKLVRMRIDEEITHEEFLRAKNALTEKEAARRKSRI